ncbi:MAG: cation:proton antiporter [Rubricoccaceae bacterium]|nr:cation:proton antiporter [Rubricoccaceae bacterium]
MNPPHLLAIGLPFLNEMVALFVVSVAIAYLCYRLRLVPIAGFLIAGVLIGPSALGLVRDQELVDVLAEVGVVLLLFTIGMEFSLAKLARIGRAIFIGGSIQVLLTVGIVAVALLGFGVSWQAGVYTGCLVALSSTAIVLGLLNERDETDTPSGRLSLAILIFQDFAIIVMVLLVPILAGMGGTPAEVLLVLGRALLLIAAVLVLARRVVPWILEKVAQTRRQELFLLTVVAICFGTAAVSSTAGVSLALGAFLAGLVVSESRYSEQALSEILPLRTVFNAVFFVSVGMLLDLMFLVENPLLVLGAAGVVVTVKLLTTMTSVLVLGYPIRIAAMVGLTLSQIGEFSFVLERAGRTAGLSPAGLGDAGAQTFIAATVLLMLLTPFQMQAAPRFGSLLSRSPLRRFGRDIGVQPAENIEPLEDHVIIAGYGVAGRRLGSVLKERNIPFIVVEMNPTAIREMHNKGIRAVYGDASRPHILEAAGIETAKLCLVVINDPGIAPRIVQQARYLNPTLQTIVRTRYMGDMKHLQKIGADIVVPEELETTVRIFSHVLGAYMIPSEEIDRHVRMIRSQDYGIMRGSIQEAHLMVLQGLDEDGMHTRAVAVRPGSPAAGSTLEELALRRNHGLTVLAVKREESTIASPAGDFRVLPDDRLILVGTADRFSECANLFRTAPSQTDAQPDT